MRATLTAFAVFASQIVGAAPSAAQEDAEYKMILGLANPLREMHQGSTPYQVFEQEVEARTGGRVDIELHPSGALGNVNSMLNQVRQGIIQGTVVADGNLAGFYPDVQAISIPYLFVDRDVAWDVLDGPMGDRLAEGLVEAGGIRPLAWLENGYRHYSNNVRPIQSPEDMAGLKIRTMEIPLHMEVVSSLGGSPTPIAWSELYTSLQTGVVDGQENSLATFMVPKLEEVQDYIILDGHVYGTQVLLVNEQWWQSLPEDIRSAMEQAAVVAKTVNRGLAVANDQQGAEYLTGEGVEIFTPTAAVKEQFKELAQPAAIAWLKDNIDPTVVDGMLEAVETAETERGYR